MEGSVFSNDLRRYLTLFWSWAWLIVLVTLLSAGIVYGISLYLTPIYRASTTLLILESSESKVADYTSLLASERMTRTYANWMTTEPVLKAVIHRLNLNVELHKFARKIKVEPVRDTQLILIQVENASPQLAVDIANTLVTVFTERQKALQTSRFTASKQNLQMQLDLLEQQIQEAERNLENFEEGTSKSFEQKSRLEANLAQYGATYSDMMQSYEEIRLAESGSISSIIQIEPAELPEKPVRPQVTLNTVLAGLIGLAFALGMVILIESLDDTLRCPGDVYQKLGKPVLGVINHDRVEAAQPIAAIEPRSPMAEAFRILRTNVQYANLGKPLNTLLITSSYPQEGKSTVAANLAITFAQGGRRVVLVDADLRRPSIHFLFGLANQTGISEIFIQDDLGSSLKSTNIPDLFVITSGETPPNPSELLASHKMGEILQKIAEHADLVILDCPPILAVADAAILASQVDSVLLVTVPGVTKMIACRQAIEQINLAGGNLAGVVLNDGHIRRLRNQHPSYQGYRYAYFSDIRQERMNFRSYRKFSIKK